MIEGILRHCTSAEIQKNYVDTHGQSEVAFAFCHLLGFRLLPRLKDIASQKLARPETGNPSEYEHLQPILSKPIDWELIKNQYDEMIKYATARRLGTAETEAILRRFTRNNLQHPTRSGPSPSWDVRSRPFSSVNIWSQRNCAVRFTKA